VIDAIKFAIEEIEASDQYFDHTPVMHPFLSATAHAVTEENALHVILEQSSDFDDFLRRLILSGYTVRERLTTEF
jgi:hypothetical protein